MERIRTQIAASFVRSRQTNNNIAIALVRSTVERDDPGALNGDLDRYRAVTAADVQRVARRYLTLANRTTIAYLPQ
jgi:zinc protease